MLVNYLSRDDQMNTKLTENEWYGVALAMLILGVVCTVFGIWIGSVSCDT